MEIREATTADYDAIVQLVPTREELFLVYPRGNYPFSVDQVRTLAEIRKELTVVVEQGKIVGFANLYDFESDRWAFIGNVVINGAHRGMGLGRKIVDHMIRTAFGKYALPEVRISVFNENTRALLLYTNLGFKPYSIEERRDPTGKRVALVHLQVRMDEYRV